jgi:hypothetical protein
MRQRLNEGMSRKECQADKMIDGYMRRDFTGQCSPKQLMRQMMEKHIGGGKGVKTVENPDSGEKTAIAIRASNMEERPLESRQASNTEGTMPVWAWD